MQPLAQPPRKDDRSFDDWMYRLWKRIASTAGLAWSLIDKTGSNITDIETRNHADLQNINTATYTHLSATHATDLTDGGDSALHFHSSDRARANHTGTQSADTVTVLNAQNADYTTVKNTLDVSLSTGVMGDSYLVTSHGDGTVDVAAANVILRATNSDVSPLTIYKAAAANLALTNLQNNYIYVQYNAGAPNYVATTVQRTDTNTNALIATVYRDGTTLHINNYAIVRANDNLRRVSLRFVQTEPIGHASGIMLSGTGTRNIGITAGVLWQCTNKITQVAFDSSVASTFTYAYMDGIGGWTEQAAQTQINNTQYDDGSGTLQTLTANRYAVAWVYQEVDADVVVLYGQGDYTLTQANSATSPASVPPRIAAQGYLIGKIILQKSAAVFLSVESAFTVSLTTSAVSDHEQLAGLLGGAANDHYHLTGTQATDLTDSSETTLHKHDFDHITYPATDLIGSPTHVTTLMDVVDHSWSAGAVFGFDLTNNGDGTISLTEGESMLRVSASETAILVTVKVAQTLNIALTDNSINYVYVNYNAGTPVVQVGTSVNDFNCLDKCILYTVTREGTILYWIDARTQNVDFNRKHRRMLLECEGFRHVIGGCALSATGTLNFAITAGAFYYGLAKITHSTFDTSVADTFIYYYRDGVGGWSKTTGNTQINNTQYDDGTGVLGTLGNNKFGVHWIYIILDNPTVLAVQFGQDSYATIADAEAALVPTAPPAIQGCGVLIGQIIIEKSAAAFSVVASAFSMSFAAATATNHNALSGLQGGAVSDYYHVTANEYGNIRSSLWAFAAAQG